MPVVRCSGESEQYKNDAGGIVPLYAARVQDRVVQLGDIAGKITMIEVACFCCSQIQTLGVACHGVRHIQQRYQNSTRAPKPQKVSCGDDRIALTGQYASHKNDGTHSR
jgi:hypothetical protein